MIKLKPRENSRDYAYRMIREMIVNMQLVPGSKVSEIELAELLGISRTPVREALIDLSKNGVVTTKPQKGTFISLIDPELIEEARFLRLTLEKELVILLCESNSDKDFSKLDELINLQEFYLKQSNYEKFLELDDEFHRYFFQMAAKSNIYSLMKGLNIHFDRARKALFKSKPTLQTLNEHKEILTAIKLKDKERAKKAIENHLTKYQFDKQLFEKEYNQYFTKTK
ncbi:hypothetical protein A4G18_06560 [Pasteurellaceae bacterium Pebbles2]|nr:hypothetical protein [Pasteurellaceae bacterium Pebbles2]